MRITKVATNLFQVSVNVNGECLSAIGNEFEIIGLGLELLNIRQH